jgi:excisionase family DNA binding protein
MACHDEESGMTSERRSSMEDLMTVSEVADHLRVSVTTVRWLRVEGRFAPAVKVGRRVLWERSTIQAWVEANREPVSR